MKLKEFSKYPGLQELVCQISQNFEGRDLKIDAHKSSHELLKLASHNKNILSEILHFSASKSGFLSGKNPPTIGLEVFRDKNNASVNQSVQAGEVDPIIFSRDGRDQGC